jgi:hypothetical protein
MNNMHTQRDRGAALLLFVVLFLATSLSLVLTIGNSVYEDLAKYRTLMAGTQSFYGAEAGIEDAIYRHRNSDNYSDTESFSFMNTDVSVSRTQVTDYYNFLAEGDVSDSVRRSYATLAIGDGASFNFGMQSGNGGITMANSSSVTGNVFSNGSISGSGNMIRGDVVSAGASGAVTSIHATGSMWAHTITSATVGKDAYYQSIVGSTVFGSVCVNAHCHPGSTDQTPAAMPIADATIENWKTNIFNTGTIISSTSTQCSSGTYTIDTDTTLNNVFIDCNVDVSKNSTDLIIAGPVWIKGNLSFSQGPNIVASSSLGTRSVQVIVDKVTNRLTSSQVSVNQSTNFNSGNVKSYTVIISMNNSAELGGTEKAINLGQTTTGKLLVYAPHGLIDIAQSTSLKEITGYKIKTANSSNIIYESGLVNLLFTSGPGGGFTIDFWKEVE